MPEQWLIDPTSEGTGTQLDISADPYAVVEFSSPAPPLETSMAGTIDTEGDLIAARRHQNRQVSFTVEVVGTSQANLDASVATLEAKVAELALQGGTFRRVRADGTYRTADILAADQFDKTFDVTYFLGNLARCTVNLIGKPYVRGPEQSLGTFSETSKPALTFSATVPGDVTATGRLLITDAQAQAQYWAAWGAQASSGATWYYEGELSTLGPSVTNSAYTGMSNGRVALKTGATSAGAKLIDVTTGGTLSLIGTYRVFGRFITGRSYDSGTSQFASAITDPNSPGTVALKWQALPNSAPSTNNPVTLPNGTGAVVVDLGLVSFPIAALGTQASQVSIVTPAGWLDSTQGIGVDAVWFMPVDEAYGEATGSQSLTLPAVYASKSLVIRHDMVLTQSGASQYSYVPQYEGDYLRLKPGSSQLIVKATRSLPGTLGDSLDDISATLFATPRYLSLF
jgi:hypothetical protein